MTDKLTCITPVDGSVYVERPLASEEEIDRALNLARQAQAAWRQVPIDERQVLLHKAIDALVENKSIIAEPRTIALISPGSMP